MYSDALVVGTITCLVVLATAALLLIASALPGQLIKSKKAPEVEEEDAGSDSESEPSVVGSDDQAASEEDEEEAYDDEGFFCDVSFPPGIAALGDMSGDSANKAKGKVDRWTPTGTTMAKRLQVEQKRSHSRGDNFEVTTKSARGTRRWRRRRRLRRGGGIDDGEGRGGATAYPKEP